MKRREDIILDFTKCLFDNHIDLFVECVTQTLATVDPKYNLPSDKRMYSGIYNHEPTCSNLIKKGLSE